MKEEGENIFKDLANLNFSEKSTSDLSDGSFF